MAIDITKAHEVNQGLLVNDLQSGNTIEGPFYTGGPSSPVGLNLPTQTIYVQNTVTGIVIWEKFNTGVNDWRVYPASKISYDVSSLTANSSDLIGLDNAQTVVAALANRSYGKRFQTVNTAGTFTTTSGTFQTIQTITTPSLELGTYMLFFSANFQKSNANSELETRFFINSSTELGLGHAPIPDDDFFYRCQNLKLVSLSGVNTIQFQMRRSIGSGNIEAQDRTLTVVRVS